MERVIEKEKEKVTVKEKEKVMVKQRVILKERRWEKLKVKC